MTKKHYQILCGILALICVACIAGLIYYRTITQPDITKIHGTYATDLDPKLVDQFGQYLISIDSETMTYDLYIGREEHLKGKVEKTDFPNVYILTNEKGSVLAALTDKGFYYLDLMKDNRVVFLHKMGSYLSRVGNK